LDSKTVPQVLDVFPDISLIAHHFFIPYCLTMVQLPCLGKGRQGGGGEKGSCQKYASILGREAYLGFNVEECPIFQKIGDGAIKWLLMKLK